MKPLRLGDILQELGYINAEQITAAGAKAVGLGPRILRCETAPLAALAAIMTLTGDLE